MFEALERGTMAKYYDAQVMSDLEVEDGVETRRLVVDTRLRDALRRIDAGDVPANRAALKLLRKENRETPTDDALLEARAHEDDPELAYMKAAYRASFKTAFQTASTSLPSTRMPGKPNPEARW